MVRVVDRGPGIPPAQQERVFEPFYTAGTQRTGHRGSGLGLAIVRGFVEANGGRVWVESLPHQGTTFALELPLEQAAGAETPARARARRRDVTGSRGRVLVCDDESQILRRCAWCCARPDYEVVPASTAAEALDLAAVQRLDAAIIDIVLPDGDGVEVARQIREWSPIPILVLSAIGEEDEKVRALQAGADDYVTKPFGPRSWSRGWRRRCVARRRPSELPVIEAGGIAAGRGGAVARRDGEEVHLTPTEFDLLRALMVNRGRLMTHAALLKEVWGPAYADDVATLRTHMANLRRKIEARRLAAPHSHRARRRLPLRRLKSAFTKS